MHPTLSQSSRAPDAVRRSHGLAAALVVASLPALFAGRLGPAMDRAFAAVDPANPYFARIEPVLLYLGVPVATLSALVLVLAPGLLWCLALGRGRTLETWVVGGFFLSLLGVSAVAAAGQAVVGEPWVGGRFVLGTLALTLSGWAALARRARRGDAPWPLPEASSAAAFALLGPPLLLVVALTPKFFWESFNGDGAHAYEATRLLLFQALPFWPEGAGSIGAFPGLNSSLFTYPCAWFLRLFGEYEVAIRLPFLLFLVVLYAVVVAIAEERPGSIGAGGRALVWLGLVSFALVMAFSATYDPYCSDIGLPATQDALLVVCFLFAVLCWMRGEPVLALAGTLLTLLASPGAPPLLGAFWLGVLVAGGRGGWKRTAMTAAGLGAAVAVTAVAPALLASFGLPAPGGEHAAGALLSKFRYVLVTDVRRLAFLVVPAGVYPIVGLFAWRRADRATRALIVTTLVVFVTYYGMAFVSLHYFVPAMLLPLVVFWRLHRPSDWRAPRAATGACAVLALGAVFLGLPRVASIYTGSRLVGASIDVSEWPGYATMEPEHFRTTRLLENLFTLGWSPEVPSAAYAGAAIAWNYYAQRFADGDQERLYRVAPEGSEPAGGGEVVAAEDGWAVWVLDPPAWEGQRAMRPAGSEGHALYAFSRDILFRRRVRAEERYAILDLREWLKKLASGGR